MSSVLLNRAPSPCNGHGNGYGNVSDSRRVVKGRRGYAKEEEEKVGKEER